MTEYWQWKHGNFHSDLYSSEDYALYWADRATTGAADDGIAVRRLVADDWRGRNLEGWMGPDPEPKPDLADVMLAWADQMEAESPTVGKLLALEVRTRIYKFLEEGK